MSRLRSRLAISSLPALLVGCSVAPEPLPPYTLSDAETMAVVRGFYASVKDLDAPNFRSFKAVRSKSGEVYVCGWMSSRNSKGSQIEQAFIGTLSAGRFAPDSIGKDTYSIGEVLDKCHQQGISIQ